MVVLSCGCTLEPSAPAASSPRLDQTLKVSGEVQSSQGHEPLNQDDGNELVKFMVVPEYQKWPTQGHRLSAP